MVSNSNMHVKRRSVLNYNWGTKRVELIASLCLLLSNLWKGILLKIHAVDWLSVDVINNYPSPNICLLHLPSPPRRRISSSFFYLLFCSPPPLQTKCFPPFSSPLQTKYLFFPNIFFIFLFHSFSSPRTKYFPFSHIFKSMRTSCTPIGWSVPPVRVLRKSGSLIYRHICLMNHEKTHQTNPMAPWDPLDVLLTP